MKSTMNKRDIAKYHKMLNQDIKPEKISKYLGVTLDTLKVFAPDALEKAKKDKGVITKPKPKKSSKKAEKPATDEE